MGREVAKILRSEWHQSVRGECHTDGLRSNKHSIKRQRTGSESGTASARKALSEDESESEHLPANASKSKKARAEAAQSARQAEVREKEKEREKARTEAAGRRQERAGRRRADDDPADETPKPTSTRPSPPASSQPASPPAQAAPEKVSHKKGAGKKVKKLGNNQYTKLREQGITPSSPHSKKRQLAKDATVSSGDEQHAGNGETHTSNSTSKNSPDHVPPTNGVNGHAGGKKFGKGKKGGVNGGPNGASHKAGAGALWGLENGERTLASMSRGIEAMARSVAAAQVEMAGSWTPNGQHGNGNGKGGPVQAPTSEPMGAGGGLSGDSKVPDDLSAMEMADLVSREIHEWQTRFGHLV